MGAPSDSPTSPAPTDLEPPADLLRLRASAFASTIASIVVTDPTRPDNPIVDVNAAFERMTGYGRDEVLGRNCRFLQGPDTDPAPVARLRAAVADQRAITETLLNYRNDGIPFWNELHLAPVCDRDGRLFLYVGVQTDVTQRIEAESRERRNARFLERIAAASPAILYVYDLSEQRNAYANVRIADILGISPDGVRQLGASVLPSLMHPDDFARLPEIQRREAEAADGEVVESEFRMRHAGGGWRWLAARETPFERGPDGAVRKIVGAALDVTAHKAEAEALRTAEERYRTLVEQLPVVVSIEATDGFRSTRFVSPQVEAVLGFTAEELTADPGLRLDLIHPDDRPRVLASIARTNASGESLCEEYRIRRRDGRELWLRYESVLVRGEQGDPLYWQGLQTDITERKREESEVLAAKDAAEAANRLKSAFLRTMSHELRTPLTAIMGYADLLRNGHLRPEDDADVAQILRSASQLLTLVDDLLDVSRFESGRIDLVLQEVDLGELVERVVADLAPRAEAKDIPVRVIVAVGMVSVRADRNRLRQAVRNLVDNAVKFTERGEVRVSVGQSDGWAEVLVADTGVGVAPEARSWIFDEFRQADSSASRRHGGSGLGLAIARRLVEAHGGTIAVESEPGVGSTFTVRLPLDG